ncbi:MAG: preprotein translocase subunit SecF [Saliniramus fredricksonii]|uniref:Protein-export membrane protein SecF n=1 Tax=Saliniramus fredricksonii TaxID=1653334 RepID=A0A0P7X5B2_9HYPH|nr:protein translocase subunit SecF [Saliniramus fredricksonii]KPQ10054.1 MAG: preprotein translocase subunit SecF [Saliniramus fredricksonii]SCC80546.1 preprotein translocase subunit SecF [Saliniramus fredricksonii]
MWLVRLVPVETRYRFMWYRRWTFPLSALLSVLAVATFLHFGMNTGIDFRGGTVMEMQAREGNADIAQIRVDANQLGFGNVEVQAFGTPRDVALRVQLQEGGEEAQQQVVSTLRDVFESDYDIRRVEVVGPRVSAELVQSGTLGVVMAIFGVLVYLWFRFEWHFAIGAVIATLHDLVLAIGFFAITQIEFNMTSIAALLTILGYSLNDTVVVYDRIRETMRKYKKVSVYEVLDIAVNATLSRTILTSVTTLLALMALAVLGGEIIKGFAYAMIFGLVVGTYSSIFVAAPILIYLGVRASSAVGSAAQSGPDAAQPAE